MASAKLNKYKNSQHALEQVFLPLIETGIKFSYLSSLMTKWSRCPGIALWQHMLLPNQISKNFLSLYMFVVRLGSNNTIWKYTLSSLLSDKKNSLSYIFPFLPSIVLILGNGHEPRLSLCGSVNIIKNQPMTTCPAKNQTRNTDVSAPIKRRKPHTR